MDIDNPYVINICTTEELLIEWLKTIRSLYTFNDFYKTGSDWAVLPGKNKGCCFCKQKSTYYLFNGYHSHYCTTKHPVCRGAKGPSLTGIIKGGEVNVCHDCLCYLKNITITSKQFIKNLLYIEWVKDLNMDVVNICASLFEKLVWKESPSILIDC